MSLTGAQHVEAIALIKALAEATVMATDLAAEGQLTVALAQLPPRATAIAALAWCEEHHPAAEDYVAAVATLAGRPPS